MHQRGPRPILGSDLFRDTYMFASNRATTVAAVEPAAGRGYFVVADAVATVDGWQTLLVAQHEGYDLVQWQRRDVTGAVTAHGEFTHQPARTLSLARSEDGWGAVDWHDGSASFYSFATRAWVAISAPDVVRWCRANEALPRFDEPLTSHVSTRSASSATTHHAAATASILLRRATNPLALEGPLSVDQIERDRTIVEYRVRREGDRWRWCIDRLSSRPIITERGAVVASEVLAAARWDLRAHESGDYASGTIIAPRSDRFVRATVRCDAIHPAR
jgi:hypothetical protein